MGFITLGYVGSFASWARFEFILCNAVFIGLLYVFQDSLLNQYIHHNKLYLNVLFHSLQFLSFIAYFIVSYKDAGQVKVPQFEGAASSSSSNNNGDIIHLNIPSDAEQDTDIDDNNNDLIGMNQVKPSTPRFDDYSKPKYIEVFVDNMNHYEFIVSDTIPAYNKKVKLDPELFDSWPSNYCEECHFIRPIRSKHCRICGKCISKFDHHCPLVSNCVGGNNYRYFLLFLWLESIVLAWTLYISVNTLFDMKIEDVNGNIIYYQHSVFGWIFRILFFVVIFILFFEIVGLFGFHLYLIITGQTTMEFMRPDFVDKYLFEEMKRKRKYIQKHQRKQAIIDQDQNQMDERKVNEVVVDKYDNYESVRPSGTRYKFQYYGNVNSFRCYFDEGFKQNFINVCNAEIKSEWKTPIKCKFKRIRNRYIDANDVSVDEIDQIQNVHDYNHHFERINDQDLL